MLWRDGEEKKTNRRELFAWKRFGGAIEGVIAGVVDSSRRTMPPEGQVRLVAVTDRQFGKREAYFGKKRKPAKDPPAGSCFFDAGFSANPCRGWDCAIKAYPGDASRKAPAFDREFPCVRGTGPSDVC